jgi:hypothetical protein
MRRTADYLCCWLSVSAQIESQPCFKFPNQTGDSGCSRNRHNRSVWRRFPGSRSRLVSGSPSPSGGSQTRLTVALLRVSGFRTRRRAMPSACHLLFSSSLSSAAPSTSSSKKCSTHFRWRRTHHFELLTPKSRSALGFPRPKSGGTPTACNREVTLMGAGWSIQRVRAMVI